MFHCDLMLYVCQLAYGLVIMHLFVMGATLIPLNDRQNDRLIFFNIVTLQLVFPILLPFRIFHTCIYPSFRSIFQHATFCILHVRDFPHSAFYRSMQSVRPMRCFV